MRNVVFALLVSASSLACAHSVDGETVEHASSATESADPCEGLSAVSPGHPAVFFSPFDGAEQKALCVLSSAQREVLVAQYNIRSESILSKLIELKSKGVRVRVVVDKDDAAEPYNTGDDRLEQSGIEVVRRKPDGKYAIMHLKASVVDGATVMTGSFNWNNTAALSNDENMLVFRDPELAAKYSEEVLQLLGDKPQAALGGPVSAGVEVHFTPAERTDGILVRELDKATQSIDAAVFTFTMQNVGYALQRAVKRGVRVRFITEKKQADLSDAEDKLEAAGAYVLRAANTLGAYSAMHQKYAIIDGHEVLTGATNWTASGTRYNDEDLLVIDSPELAQSYRRNFADMLWNYAGNDLGAADASLSRTEARALFRVVNDKTSYGDRTVVVGGDPALGSWDPWRGVDGNASDLFPSWAARARFAPGTRVEYKYVMLRTNGEVVWEPGPNRVLDLPTTGRNVIVSGTFGDTSRSWTPRD